MSLINTKIIRQGLMKKAPTAKKKDEVRKGTWQERWFVLKKTTLYYYKKREDTRPKGEIDLRAAIIEDADVKTRREFTIRIHQASQLFNYLQCSSQGEKDAWLDDIKAAAGYKEAQPEEKVKTNEYYSSFGVLKQGLDGNLRRVVLIPDEKKQLVHVAFEQQFVKRYSTGVIRKATSSKNATVSNFYEVRLVLCPDPRLPNDLKEKVFYMATKDEAKSCATLLNNFCQGDRSKIQELTQAKPKQKGFLEMQGLAEKAWVRLWAVLVEKRCLLYNSVDDTIPVWIVWISNAPTKEGRCGLSYRDPHQTWNFRFEAPDERDEWAEAFEKISRSFEQQLTDQLDSLELEKPLQMAPEQQKAHNEDMVRSSKKIAESTSTYVVTWGNGRGGQLGNGTSQSTSFPQLTRLLADKKVRSISAGSVFGAVTTRHGQCYTWGSGKHGELGLGEHAQKKNYPCLVVSLRSTSVTSVCCGRAHCLALTGNGQVFSWGSGEKGQLGLGNVGKLYKPKIVPFFRDFKVGGASSESVAVIQVAAGGRHSAAILEGHSAVYTWGDNASGQLGLGDAAGDRILKPEAVPIFNASGEMGSRACAVVDCGENTTAFLATSGELYMSGANSSGQLGLGDNRMRKTPAQVDSSHFGSGSLSHVIQVKCGAHHTLAVAGGQLYAWGAAMLNGRSRSSTVPGKPVGEALFIACSATHSAFVDKKFNVVAFGQNEFGELGVDEETTGASKSLLKSNLAQDLECLALSCGDHFTIALMEGKRPDRLHHEKEVDKKAIEAYANEQAENLLSTLNQQANPASVNANAAEAEAPLVNPAPATAAPEATAKPPEKQGMWKEVMDPKSGRPYYYHTITRQTRWKRPTDGLPIVKKHVPNH
mmetsp:Transcript_24942/g.59983  ORF Transcript_24942/g.59983 Transcript_24942/m.59983 type:complete len:872 (-) Transcript_24942:170-2785(-)